MKVLPTTVERFGSALSPDIAIIMPKDVARAKSWLGTVRHKIATAGVVTAPATPARGGSPQ